MRIARKARYMEYGGSTPFSTPRVPVLVVKVALFMKLRVSPEIT